MKKSHKLTYDLPDVICQADTKFNSRSHALAGDPPSSNLCIHSPFNISVAMERNSVGGKHGGEGFVSCMLCCPELSTLSHVSLLGHAEDLQSAFLWVRKFYLIRLKEVRLEAHVVQENGYCY